MADEDIDQAVSVLKDLLNRADECLAELALILAVLNEAGQHELAQKWADSRLGMPSDQLLPQVGHTKRVRSMPRKQRRR